MRYIETPAGVRYSQDKDGRGMHRIRWTDPATGENRDARRKTFDDARTEAFRLDRQLTDAAKRGPHRGRRPDGTTVADLVDHFLDPANRLEPWAKNTADNYRNFTRNRIVPIIGHLPCRDWTPQHSEAVLRAARPDYVDSSLAALRVALSALAKHGRKHGFMEHDPLADVAGPTTSASRRLIDSDELPTANDIDALGLAMAAVADEPWRHLQVMLAAYTGLRAGELHALHADDVNLDGGYIRVVRQVQRTDGGLEVKPPKHRGDADTARRTPLPVWLEEPLARRFRELDQPIVFPSPKGGYVNHAAFLTQRFYPAAEAAGWYQAGGLRWKWHDLRHFFCTWALSRDGLGLGPEDVALFAGHHSPSFTYDRYVGRSGDAIARAREAGGTAPLRRVV